MEWQGCTYDMGITVELAAGLIIKQQLRLLTECQLHTIGSMQLVKGHQLNRPAS